MSDDEIYGPYAPLPEGENVSSIPQRYAHHFDQAWKERNRRGQVGTSGHLILKTDGLGVRLPKDGAYGLDGTGDFMPESEMRDDPGLNELPKEEIVNGFDYPAWLRELGNAMERPDDPYDHAGKMLRLIADEFAASRARITELEAAADAAAAELSQISTAICTVRFMDPPDGGDVSLAEQVRRMRKALEAAVGSADAARLDWLESNADMILSDKHVTQDEYRTPLTVWQKEDESLREAIDAFIAIDAIRRAALREGEV